ncbi:Predicted transcriptional regulator, ArsR family [Paenibacillus uliginis N3/975]|uniref:Predicted transcriptional regulator, ArsR family n=1 Tax=Paenibacillus uliginis N3/975 TaxID=1313296 RepID=A0A1X7HRC4_9BACL|nr:metalloregulator ArsR/SmtB family transcription factor [Paenibacillus uliginis]SMF91358.1 Predicted transcriptional regulator, ArsR family [Paenibacillus uliginis N3/975]
MEQTQELSTRDTILHMLKTQGPLSAKSIASTLLVTEMAVRRHLGSFEKDGVIETELVRQAMGRPLALYRLSPHAESLFPNKYSTLSLDLLDELTEEAGEEMVTRLFERRRNKLRQRYESGVSGKELADRVRTLTDIQNDNGYMAECEQTDDGKYVIKEHNCPISQIANRYNQACSCELELFSSLLQAKVERTECLASGGCRCVYVITE